MKNVKRKNVTLSLDKPTVGRYNMKERKGGVPMEEKTTQYRVTGMSCAACSGAVERVTRKLEGVVSSDVNLIMAKMTITYDESKLAPERIMAAVERAGFGIRPDIRGEKLSAEDFCRLADYLNR